MGCLQKEFKDVSAWIYAEMPGLDSQLVTYQLNIIRNETGKASLEELPTKDQSADQAGKFKHFRMLALSNLHST